MTLHHLLGCAFLADRNIEEGSTAEIYIQKVIKASNRAKDMVGRILAFSRKALQVCISVDIFKVVVEALDMLRISAPSSIKIEKDLQDLEPGQYVRLRLSGTGIGLVPDAFDLIITDQTMPNMSGIQAFLQKPVLPNMLTQTIRRVLKKN